MADNLVNVARQQWTGIRNAQGTGANTAQRVGNAGLALANAVEFSIPRIGANGNWWVGGADSGVLAEGAPGTDGKSAYQSALDGGFVGSETQFYQALGILSAEASQIGINKTNIEALQNLFGEFNGVSVAWKDEPGNKIILEPNISQYNLQISQNSTITINRDLIPRGRNIAFTTCFNVSDFVSIQFADNVQFQDGRTMTDIGEYWYSFFYDEEVDMWFAKLDYSIIRFISPTAKFLFVDGKNGNDAASGLTWQEAKQTIQNAIDAADEGDGIMIMGYDDGFEYLPTTERVPGTPTSRSFIMKNGVFLFGGCVGTELTPADIQMRAENVDLKLPSGIVSFDVQVPVLETILSGDLNQENTINPNVVNGNRYTGLANNAVRVISGVDLSSITRIAGCVITRANGELIRGSSVLTFSACIFRDDTGTNSNSALGLGGVKLRCVFEFLTNGAQSASNSSNFSIYRNSTGEVGTVTNLRITGLVTLNTSHLTNCYVSGSGVVGGQLNLIGCFFENHAITGSANVVTTIQRTIFQNCNFIVPLQLGNGNAANVLISNCTANTSIIARHNGGVLTNISIINCICNSPLILSQFTVRNCVFWGNRTNLGNVATLPNVATYTNCAAEGQDLTGIANINLSSQNTGTDSSPYFTNPSQNAGFTNVPTDYTPLYDSVLKDAGNSGFLTAENLMFDVRRNNRVVGDNVDVGALEFQG